MACPLIHLGHLNVCGKKYALSKVHPALGEVAEGRGVAGATKSLGKACPGH